MKEIILPKHFVLKVLVTSSIDGAFSKNVIHFKLFMIINGERRRKRLNTIGKRRRVGNKRFQVRNVKDRMDFNMARKL